MKNYFSFGYRFYFCGGKFHSLTQGRIISQKELECPDVLTDEQCEEVKRILLADEMSRYGAQLICAYFGYYWACVDYGRLTINGEPQNIEDMDERAIRELLNSQSVVPFLINEIVSKILIWRKARAVQIAAEKAVEKAVRKEYTALELKFFAAVGWSTTSVAAFRAAKENDRIAVGKEISKRAKALRKKAVEYLQKNFEDVKTIEEWHAHMKAEEKVRKMTKREREQINQELIASCGRGIYSLINTLRVGTHTGSFTATYDTWNGIEVSRDSEQYSSRCSFEKIIYSYKLHIRKGFKVAIIGGLITFYRGEMKREGIACEWITQGKAIADISIEKGFLVRGEHIKAKTLKEAQAISRERRAGVLARLLSARKRVERRREAAENGTLKITFADSVASGNCRFGTADFKHKYEEAIGREAKSITLSDLRKYAKLFGVEYYAERVIRHVLAK